MTFSLAHGLEGIVGKPLGSTYRPGQRGPWIKIKHSRHQEAVIAGWTPGAGRRSTMIGSLILGIYEDHGLTYIGNVGTGFTDEALRTLAKRLEPLHRPDNPFDTSLPHQIERTAHWVEPELVGEVAYTEWTPDGHLRHPSWRGLRPDKRPEQIHRELARNSVDRPEVEHPGDDAASHPNPPRNRTAEIPTRMRSRASA